MALSVDQTTTPMPDDAGSAGDAGIPERIGPYRILQVLAQGGMGLVYVAEQSEPVRRRVALKVIKAGMDTHEVVARFEAERQALAVMDHPYIAKVLDGGATPDGRPYFVMELVKGIPITDYCDLHKLRTRERLRIFIDVCHAVQHAHQKGVVHRDIKPSNVLVMLQDGTPAPKVIDFGIAKALSQSLTDHTLVTQVGQAMGTPAYMSPEQADPSALDVDTRTDVYSMGVLLYELLVGRLPLDPSELGLPVFMARLAQRDTNLSAPSVKLGTLGSVASSISLNRRSDLRELRRELKGDLDWIVMKAMDPDRNRRYDTINGLAMDLERFLRSEPVVARPPSTAYRVSRFARRNRVAVTAGAVVMVSLLIGLTVVAASLVRTTRAEALARQEAETARQVAALLTGLFQVSDPGEARGNSITAREILDRGAERLRSELTDQPVVQAQMLYTIGNVYRELGLFEQARPLLEQSMEIRRRLFAPDDSTVLAGMMSLGRLAQQQGRFDVADSLYRDVLSTADGNAASRSVDVAMVLSSLGGMYVTRGRYAEAESLLTRAVALRTERDTSDHTDFARLLRNLGAAYLAQGQLAEAEPVFLRVLAMSQRLQGADHPDVGRTLSNLGVVYYGLAQYDKAEQYYVQAEQNLTTSLGADHPNIASMNINLGETAWRRGQLSEAETRLRRALDILSRRVEPTHPSVGTAEYALANVLRDAGRSVEADAAYRRALSIREAALGVSSPAVAEVLRDHAELLQRLGRSDEAARLRSRADAVR
jgi:eukaryotic-like serine/threonine-protein kinase